MIRWTHTSLTEKTPIASARNGSPATWHRIHVCASLSHSRRGQNGVRQGHRTGTGPLPPAPLQDGPAGRTGQGSNRGRSRLQRCRDEGMTSGDRSRVTLLPRRHGARLSPLYVVYALMPSPPGGAEDGRAPACGYGRKVLPFPRIATCLLRVGANRITFCARMGPPPCLTCTGLAHGFKEMTRR